MTARRVLSLVGAVVVVVGLWFVVVPYNGDRAECGPPIYEAARPSHRSLVDVDVTVPTRSGRREWDPIAQEFRPETRTVTHRERLAVDPVCRGSARRRVATVAAAGIVGGVGYVLVRRQLPRPTQPAPS